MTQLADGRMGEAPQPSGRLRFLPHLVRTTAFKLTAIYLVVFAV